MTATIIVCMLVFVAVSTLIGVLAFVRYRAMVPLIYLVLLVLLARQKVIGLLYPIPRAPEAPGGMIVLAMLAVTLFGCVLSVLDTRKKQAS